MPDLDMMRTYLASGVLGYCMLLIVFEWVVSWVRGVFYAI